MVKLKIKSDHTGLMVPNKLTVEEFYFRLALKLYELLYTDSEFQLVDGRPAAFLEASSVEKDIIVRMAAKEFTKLDSTKLKLIIRLIPKFKKEFNS